MKIRRFYWDQFNPEIHESTADCRIVDLCEKCVEDIKAKFYSFEDKEEELITPPYMTCDDCNIIVDNGEIIYERH